MPTIAFVAPVASLAGVTEASASLLPAIAAAAAMLELSSPPLISFTIVLIGVL